MVTVDELQLALPASLKKAASQELADMINNATNDPEMARSIRENFISYTGVLKDGRFKTEDYLNAVTYVSYKLMGDVNRDAWAKTFPQRYARLKAQGVAEKDIAAHVTAYNRGQLVNKILEQSLVPTWVLNQDLYQDALNVQAMLMRSSPSDKVRSDAANSILTHLKKPEGKIEVDLNVKDSSGMNELKQTLADLASTQRTLIENGVGIKTVADSKLIQVDPEEENKVSIP